jgi:hypothetical protein
LQAFLTFDIDTGRGGGCTFNFTTTSLSISYLLFKDCGTTKGTGNKINTQFDNPFVVSNIQKANRILKSKIQFAPMRKA